MSPEQQRIAIAEFCGFVWYRIPKAIYNEREHRMLALPALHEYRDQSPKWMVRADGTERICDWQYMAKEGHVPDYLNDWNAMHNAVNSLRKPQRLEFLMALNGVTQSGEGKAPWFPSRFLDATISQWAEALLRAIGKWVEEKP